VDDIAKKVNPLRIIEKENRKGNKTEIARIT
jgi:hypothetical protein